jgi:TusA-related sulfurtransferase
MKAILYFLVLVIGTPLVATADDKLVSYDPAASVITVDRSGQLKTFRLRPITEFTVNGVKATLDKLQPGMKLNISLSDPQTVSRIAVIAAQPLKSNGRSIVIKMRVEGSEMVHIKNGGVVIEHNERYAKPTEISINGTEWQPKWNGNLTEPFTSFDPPLVPFGQTKPSFKQVLGRNKASMDKMPQGDFEKVATIRLADTNAGADVYEVQVAW